VEIEAGQSIVNSASECRFESQQYDRPPGNVGWVDDRAAEMRPASAIWILVDEECDAGSEFACKPAGRNR
jgi:hypothetical protein